MKKLEILAVGDLRPGMRVAAAVQDAAGRILLPAGAEITESTIASLVRREIEQVSVELEVEDDPAALEAQRQQVAAQLDRLFRKAGQGAETRALYDVIGRYRMEHRP